MKILPCILLTALAGAASATPVATRPAPPAAAAAAMPRRFPGMSDDGYAALTKAQTAPDPQLKALAQQARAAHDQLMAATMAPVIDIDKVTAAIRAEEAVQTQLRAHNNDRLLSALKQLPDGDRGIFLRTLVLARQPRTAAPTAAAATQP